MNERRPIAVHPAIWTFALFGLAALFAIVAARFAAQQSVWTDEATQLSGLSLTFSDQLRWLAGRLPHAFAVPPDRTPPLSYWLGSIWQHAFGDGVLTARYLSVCLSVGSVFVLWTTAREYLDRRAAFIAAALLAMSPNFVVAAAEVRAYALFIFLSTVLIYFYLKLLADRPAPSNVDLWAFAVVSMLCSYTHFFGVVISGGGFMCLFISYRCVGSQKEAVVILRKAKWPLIFYSISMIGLLPFIIGAMNYPGGGATLSANLPGQASARMFDFVRLIYRLFSHQSMLGIPGLALASLLAGLTLMSFSVIPGSDPRCKQLLLFILVNFTLIVIAGLTTSAFGAFAPTYNVWILPVTALLASTALHHRNRHVRSATAVCISVLIAADCYAAVQLSTAGEVYDHTRSTVLKAAIDAAGPKNVIVLYGNDAPSLYFAMIYDYGDHLRQYIASESSVHRIGASANSSSRWICDRNANTLIVANDQQLSADALQSMLAHPGTQTRAYYALNEFLEAHRADLSDKWTLVSTKEYLAQSALAIAIFETDKSDAIPDSTNCDTP